MISATDIETSQSYQNELACGGTSICRLRGSIAEGFSVEKKLLPKFQSKLAYELLQQNEYDILSELNHPLIVKVKSLELQPSFHGMETRVLVLEYVEGCSLADCWDLLRSFSDCERLVWGQHFMDQILSAFEYMRSRKVVHGDLAPENILIDCSGRIRLIDFGLAHKDSDSTEKLSFRIAGREAFRAPEHRQDGKSSLAGDVYSVGRVCEEVFGERLFSESPQAEALKQMIEERKLPTRKELGMDDYALAVLKPLPVMRRTENFPLFRKPTPILQLPKLRKTHFLQRFREAIILASYIGLTSWCPTARLEVNSFPFSKILIETGAEYIQRETPIQAMDIPSGKIILGFYRASDGVLLKTREYDVRQGQTLKVFEDFRNIDNLDK